MAPDDQGLGGRDLRRGRLDVEILRYVNYHENDNDYHSKKGVRSVSTATIFGECLIFGTVPLMS